MGWMRTQYYFDGRKKILRFNAPYAVEIERTIRLYLKELDPQVLGDKFEETIRLQLNLPSLILHGWQFLFDRQCFDMVISDGSFDRVPEGAMLPVEVYEKEGPLDG